MVVKLLSKYVIKATSSKGEEILLPADSANGYYLALTIYESPTDDLFANKCSCKEDIYSRCSDFTHASKAVSIYKKIEYSYNENSDKKEHLKYTIIPVTTALSLLANNPKVPEYRKRYKKGISGIYGTINSWGIKRINNHWKLTKYKKFKHGKK